MKKILTLTVVLFTGSLFYGQAQIVQKVESFDIGNVRLLDSPFKHAEDLDLKYMLELNPDRLLAPFLREAGLPQKAESYTNWENTGLDGHIGGHYLSALSLMYAATGDFRIKERLDYMVGELKKCQDANGNGYIGGVPGGKAIWEEVANGKIDAGGFSLNGKGVPLYNIHKTYAGLRDAYLYAHNQEAKEMLIKMTDWAIKL
ncbi:MAG: glycosyl hydrolase, partial [Pseudopedobacter saltans]